MKKTIASILLSMLCWASYAQTINCNGNNPWVSTQTYNTGTTITFNGVLYQANFYNFNAPPNTNAGDGQPWTNIGTCAVPISPKTASCSNLSNWSAATAYSSNIQVVYNNYVYQWNYYSAGVQPDINNNSSNGPWILIGQCQSAASVTATGSLTPFKALTGASSSPQSVALSGSNLSGNITITAPANFEISLNASTGFTSSLTVAAPSGTITGTTLYIIYSPAAIGTDNGFISISGGGITTETISVTGTATGIWIANGNDIYNGNTANVGVGTGPLSPLLGKLHVNGTSYLNGNTTVVGDARFSGKVATTEVFVTATPLITAFPDYVFESSYKLMPLDTLENYIQIHKHLPDVPSAKSIEEAGKISLGEMNNTLLKKVEELTLYLIQQQKLIQEQGDLQAAMQEERRLMEQRIRELENAIK